ncbi:MAG: acyltransferase family protein [Planctomycetales bacterium]|nr:acyltransferase family protein [Planctomycetales bacterium]
MANELATEQQDHDPPNRDSVRSRTGSCDKEAALDQAQAMAQSPESGIRFHDMDSLRAAMMLLGLVFHVAWFFQPIYFWNTLSDSQGSIGFQYFFTWVHQFRMQVFFLIAGFFACLLIRKRGLLSFAKNRFLRVVIPLLISMLTIWPLMKLQYLRGVLLYELLTGTTPLTNEDLKQAAQEEIFRSIRESEPPRPSNRISTLGPTAITVSQCRRSQPDQLGRTVKGDLDWIVMKALAKERGRRYKTSDALAEDIQRHLNDVPIDARPPSTAYQLSRFYRRNKALVNVTGFVVLIMFATSLAVIGSSREAERSRRRAANEVYVHNLNLAASGKLKPESWRYEGVQLGIDEDRIEFILGFNRQMLGDLVQAQAHYVTAMKVNPKNASVMSAGRLLALQTGRYEDYFDQSTLELLQRAVPTNPEDYLFLASSKMISDSPTEAKKLADIAVKSRPSTFAIAVRAKVIVWLYLMTGDSQELMIVDKHLEALHQLQDVYPMSPYFLETQLFVKTALVIFASEIDRARYTAEAREVADLLVEKYPRFGPARYRRAVFLDIIGETEASLEEWSAATTISGMSGWSVDEAFRKYRIGRVQEVGNSLDTLSLNSGDVIRALFFDTESGRAGATVRAKKAFHTQKEKQTFDELNLRLLLFTGDLKTSTSMAKELLSRDIEPTTLWSRWERSKLQYYASGDADVLLEIAGNSPVKQCDAFSLIGARLMCEGRRADAIRYFEQAIGTRVVWWRYHQVSDVYLERMKSDEGWPDWFPANDHGHL